MHQGVDLTNVSMCPVVSGTKQLAEHSLSPIGCEVGPPWIGFGPGHPIDAQSDEIWGILRPRQHLQLFAPQTIPEQVLRLWQDALSC